MGETPVHNESAFRYGETWEERARRAALPHQLKVAKARKTFAQLDRFELEAIADAAISLLDEMGGDPDLEDENDAERSEGWSYAFDAPAEIFRGNQETKWPATGDALTPNAVIGE